MHNQLSLLGSRTIYNLGRLDCPDVKCQDLVEVLISDLEPAPRAFSVLVSAPAPAFLQLFVESVYVCVRRAVCVDLGLQGALCLRRGLRPRRADLWVVMETARATS